jgi:hypothetical protein
MDKIKKESFSFPRPTKILYVSNGPHIGICSTFPRQWRGAIQQAFVQSKTERFLRYGAIRRRVC